MQSALSEKMNCIPNKSSIPYVDISTLVSNTSLPSCLWTLVFHSKATMMAIVVRVPTSCLNPFHIPGFSLGLSLIWPFGPYHSPTHFTDPDSEARVATGFAPDHGASKQQDRRLTQTGVSSALFISPTLPTSGWLKNTLCLAGWGGAGGS